MAGGVDPYVSRWTTPESAALRLLDERTAAADWSRRSASEVFLEQEMLSGHVEGQFLKMLVHVTGARRVLEIGMFTGYSALAMAEALPADGIVIACEIDAEVAAFAQRCFAASDSGHQVEVRLGPALSTLEDLARSDQEFDLIFIDADKAGYLAYLNVVLDTELLAPHGLICVDNTLMQGQPWCPPSRRPMASPSTRFQPGRRGRSQAGAGDHPVARRPDSHPSSDGGLSIRRTFQVPRVNRVS